jgi:hypothetical protein
MYPNIKMVINAILASKLLFCDIKYNAGLPPRMTLTDLAKPMATGPKLVFFNL